VCSKICLQKVSPLCQNGQAAGIVGTEFEHVKIWLHKYSPLLITDKLTEVSDKSLCMSLLQDYREVDFVMWLVDLHCIFGVLY